MYRKILVPLDGSELSERALRHAHELAKNSSAEILLLQVLVFVSRDYDVIPIDEAASGEALAEAKRYLERVAGNLRRLGDRVTTYVESGYVADIIVDFSENNHCDVIVMSTHGRSGALRWLVGSVADRVVQISRIPVLLIRAQPK